LFWFGLFLLMFLGWSWIRSAHFVDLVEYESGPSQPRVAIGHGGGSAGFVWDVHAGNNGLRVRSLPAPDRWFHLPPAAIEGSSSGNLYFTIAHWFLILLFLVPWTLCLLWRGRRMKSRTADFHG
jgi:hypothetical protein